MNKQQDFLEYMKQFIGLPYIWGGDNPKRGLDCSGLCQLLLAWLRLDPPGDQTADGLKHHFLKNGEVIDIREASMGCLIFYGKKNKKATHIGMIIKPELMIEAGGGGPTTRTPAIARLQKASVRWAKPTRRSDIQCIIRPYNLFSRLAGE